MNQSVMYDSAINHSVMYDYVMNHSVMYDSSMDHSAINDSVTTVFSEIETAGDEEMLFSTRNIIRWTTPVGLVGNILLCLVIATKKSLRNTMNYYLFSLAIADILTLFALYVTTFVVEMFEKGINIPELVVKLLIVVNNMSCAATVCITTALTVDRYIGVCHPLKALSLSTESRTIKINLVLWTFAFLFSISEDVCLGLGLFFCEVFTYLQSFEVLATVFFLLPVIIIMILYARMVITIKRSARLQMVCGNRKTTQEKQTRKGLTIATIVIMELLICWGSAYVYYFLLKYNVIEASSNKDWYITYAIELISTLSAIIDPLIYSVMSAKFRTAFKELFLPLLVEIAKNLK